MRQKEDAQSAKRELKGVAEKYGFGLTDLVGGAGARRDAGKGPRCVVRFRHPDDLRKTWSGHGRKPVWIKQ